MTEQVQTLEGAADPPPARPARPGTRRRRRWETRYRTSAALGDVVIGGLVVLALSLLKFGPDLGNRAWMLFAAPAIWLLALEVTQTYRPQTLGTGTDEYRAIGKAALLVACTTALAGFILDARLPRSIVVPLVPLMMVGSLLSHWYFRRDLQAKRQRGLCLVNTVVVGRADSVAAMIKEIGTEPESGMRVVAACVSGLDSGWSSSATIEGVPVFGPPESA
ncbi:MAG: hypothetical protein ABI083_16260, partial [Lapillicoccus sp.]